MVAWLKPLALALLLALLAHLLALTFIHAHMPLTGSILEQRNDPLFTRTISSASLPAPVPEPSVEAPKPASPVRSVSSRPRQPTPTIAETPAKDPEPNPAASVAEQASETIASTTPSATVSALSTTLTATATTSEAAVSSTTSGSDSLIVTGEWPADTRVSYQLSGFYLGDLHGSGRVQWTRSGNQREKYQVNVEARIPGLYKLNMTSQGRVGPQGLLPEAYEETVDRTGAKTRLRTLRLEPQDVVFDNGARSPRPATEPMAVQDAVSQFIDLGHRFTQGRQRLEAGQAINIWLGRPGGLDEWTYDVNEAEILHLPRIGEIQVHRLRPRPLTKPRGPLVMEMWLAPSLQYLPAKIRITLDAQSYVELTATQIEQN
jgi:Protein of unknown function (DUF3108)